MTRRQDENNHMVNERERGLDEGGRVTLPWYLPLLRCHAGDEENNNERPASSSGSPRARPLYGDLAQRKENICVWLVGWLVSFCFFALSACHTHTHRALFLTGVHSLASPRGARHPGSGRERDLSNKPTKPTLSTHDTSDDDIFGSPHCFKVGSPGCWLAIVRFGSAFGAPPVALCHSIRRLRIATSLTTAREISLRWAS